jgi:hypothetical protein
MTQSADGSAVLQIVLRIFSLQKYLVHLFQLAVLLLKTLVVFLEFLCLLRDSQVFAVKVQEGMLQD